MKKFYIFLVLTLVFISVSAQRFPIRVFPQVNPPAPVNFYSYADASTLNSPLRVRLLLGDLSIANRQIRLKVSFEGNGINFTGSDNVAGAPQLFIDGGIPLVLNNVELAPYFEVRNLQGIGPGVYGRTIPEGSYQFCFEVFDMITGGRLSKRSCATTFIFKNEPPFLNLPLNEANIEPAPVDNIVFQWAPRHINVSNVEYELSIVEIWDNNVDPQTAFLSSPPVFQTTTRATGFVYGPAQPLLLHDKRYAWQVRAKALKGAEEIGLFKNGGKSGVFWFSKTSPCDTPMNVRAEPKGISKMNVFWDEDPAAYTEYEIAYREKGRANSRWFTKRTNAGWATVWDLKPNTAYEYKVRGKCKFQYSDYTKAQETATASAEDATANYNCGIVPDAVAITNRKGKPNILIGDRITAGDFVVTITDITAEADGVISGSGFVRVPYFEMARFGVSFDNILINTDDQLAEGEIVTLYDPFFGEDMGMVVEVPVAEWLDSVGGLIDGLKDKIEALLNSGNITGEQAAALQEEISQQATAVKDLGQNEEREEELRGLGKEEEADRLKEENKKDRETIDEATKDVAKKVNALEQDNQVAQNGGVTTGGYFDGAIPFSTPDETIKTSALEQGTTFSAPSSVPTEKNPDGTFFVFEAKKVGTSGKVYIVSKSNMGDEIEDNEDYKAIKQRMASLSNGGTDQYILWMHYDFKNNTTNYKVAFDPSYYENKIAQNELAQLYNDVLNFDIRGSIGTAIIGTATYFDTLLLEMKGYAPFMNEEFLNPGHSTYGLLQMVVQFIKDCGQGYIDQDTGLVPKCFWDQNTNPGVAYYAGFIDGAFEIAELGWGAVQFFEAWNLGKPYFYDPKAAEIRKQTIDLVLMIKKLDKEEVFLSTVWDQVAKSFGDYLKETVALSPQARYNQGKLIFEAVSLFFGIGEAKAFLTTGKITSKTLVTLRKLPLGFAKFVKSAGKGFKVAIKKLTNGTSQLLINGREIATIVEKRIVLAKEVFLESLDENLQTIGQLVTPDGYRFAIDNGNGIEDIGHKILNIIEDSKGKYRAAVGKISNNVGGSKYGKSVIASKRGFINQLNDLLTKEGLTIDDFHYMMQKTSTALTTSEKAIMDRIRNSIPKPNSTSVMQKVIPKSDIAKYLRKDNPYNNIGGYVTKASDAKHLISFDDIYHGLRLDYTGTTFFIEEGSCAVIRFTSKNTKNVVIPSGGSYSKYDYPFTAHGFTAGKNGRVGTPEWHLQNRIDLDDGAELWEVFSDGTEVLKGKFIKDRFQIIE